MKTKKRFSVILLLILIASGTTVITAFNIKGMVSDDHENASQPGHEEGCVFKTAFEGEEIDSHFIYKTPEKVSKSIDNALAWVAKAQLKNGGWGAGSHYNQNVMDPHSVNADPATTAMVAMALLRCGNTLYEGIYSTHINKALEFLLTTVENSPENDLNITSEVNTQPQTKLGVNIDVVLASQFLTNIHDYLQNDRQLQERVKKCMNKCVAKIQKAQDSDGSLKGAGWAGVLQSSFANNALETALFKGAEVDTAALQRSREYQKSNYDVESGSVATERAAGVMLYSVSGSGRATANEARIAREKIDKAKREGKLDKDDEVTAENLKKAGLSEAEAYRYSGAYEVNMAASAMAQNEDVLTGFGNNGGEEFLSFLQTGEGLIISKDTGWKKWYDNTTGRLLQIQNNDGSWNGHHCITSPVFCTATCLLILSVNNDVEELLLMGME